MKDNLIIKELGSDLFIHKKYMTGWAKLNLGAKETQHHLC